MSKVEEKIVIKFYDELLCRKIQRLRREGLDLGRIIRPYIEEIILKESVSRCDSGGVLSPGARTTAEVVEE